MENHPKTYGKSQLWEYHAVGCVHCTDTWLRVSESECCKLMSTSRQIEQRISLVVVRGFIRIKTFNVKFKGARNVFTSDLTSPNGFVYIMWWRYHINCTVSSTQPNCNIETHTHTQLCEQSQPKSNKTNAR